MRIHTASDQPRSSRRHFLGSTAAASFSALALGMPTHGQMPSVSLPTSFSALKPLGSRVRPITPSEFGERLQHAQQLMSGAPSASSQDPQPARYDALFLAPGTSMYY